MYQNNDNGLVKEVALEDLGGEQDRLEDTTIPGIEGARAALETFYYAFNGRSPDLLQKIWAEDPLAQLVSPFGFLRGSTDIKASYARIRDAPVQIQTVLEGIVVYYTPNLAIFTMRERGTAAHCGNTEPAEGRTLCIFRFLESQGGWRLIYHQVSLTDPETFARLRGEVPNQAE
jgi:ketosteroid isomerase-like protein